MRRYLIHMIGLLAAMLLTACDKDVHDKPKDGNGFLSVALLWEDEINSSDEIESVNLWIYDKTGALSVEQEFLSAGELALQKYELGAGNVVAVVGVNVKEPVEQNTAATAEDLEYELARQGVLYEMTFYGDQTAEVVSGESRIVYVPLHDDPQDDTFIEGDGDINDWEDGEDGDGEILNPNK